MLKIQRASAGSGKTYALAKNFILNLIAFKNNKGKWQIRNEKQIEESIKHILAITFTNKATNEMKERIINNLSLLSKVATLPSINEDIITHTPYLREFGSITDASYKDIGTAAGIALKVILNDFSQFRISTIDSFFQEILRTFTFEANLNDTYQLEIDSTFVTEASIDAAMHQLDTKPREMGNASFWLKTIIQNESKKSQRWNIFNKKSNNNSLYYRLYRALLQLESENFKEVKEILDLYVENNGESNNLVNVYKNLRTLAIQEKEGLLKTIKKCLNRIEDLLRNNSYSDTQLKKNFLQHISVISDLKINDSIPFQFNKIMNEGSVFLKKFQTEGNPLDEAALKFYKYLVTWNQPSAHSFQKAWIIYGELLPYLGLLLEIKVYLSKILENNNLIQISETGFILKKIIGDDDTSFVYERLGNRIDNYLIDEFQDTSGLQWDILYPLLNESEARGNDSLIIGDPKQSIYRFRNADHSLITEVVPNAFPNHEEAGFTPEDNTNWRSHLKIVEFNNYFFKMLADLINKIGKGEGSSGKFMQLFSNVVQLPHNNDGKGYVEVRLFEKPDEEEAYSENFADVEGEISKDWYDRISLSNLTELIADLIKRGYNQKDIGVLVDTNEKGKEVVEALIAYNENLPEGQPRIDFISEESLLVSSSPAVEVIIGIIEKLAQPSLVSDSKFEDSGEESKRPRYLVWNQIKMDYAIFSNLHPGLSPAEKINQFINNLDPYKYVSLIYKNTPVPSISSIIESIVSYLLDDSLKESEALYIASLQDLVNDYSQSHPDDPASFLEWWKTRGSKMAVSSPEGTEAIKIMTIHKSKGLEFKCVILPFATDKFTPSSFKEEWRWVRPFNPEGIDLPPVLPIKTSSGLKGSVHEEIYNEYFNQVLTDKLNMYYVAFTRAQNELYIFTKQPGKKNSDNLSYFLYQIFSPQTPVEIFEEEEKKYILSLNDLEINDSQNIISYGTPFTKEEIKEENIKSKKVEKTVHRYFDNYYVNKSRPKLKTKAVKVLPSGEFTNEVSLM